MQIGPELPVAEGAELILVLVVLVILGAIGAYTLRYLPAALEQLKKELRR